MSVAAAASARQLKSGTGCTPGAGCVSHARFPTAAAEHYSGARAPSRCAWRLRRARPACCARHACTAPPRDRRPHARRATCVAGGADRRGVAEPNQRPASVKASLSGGRFCVVQRCQACLSCSALAQRLGRRTAQAQHAASKQHEAQAAALPAPALAPACCTPHLPVVRTAHGCGWNADNGCPCHAPAVAFGQRAPNRAGAREQGRGMGADLQRELPRAEPHAFEGSLKYPAGTVALPLPALSRCRCLLLLPAASQA